MQELIESIRVAVGADASSQQKSTGVQACRTILAALDSEPGKPLAMPGTVAQGSASRVPVDQMLDLMIARLTTIAAERDTQSAPVVTPPRGMRVPVAPVPVRRALARPTQQPKRPIGRKP